MTTKPRVTKTLRDRLDVAEVRLRTMELAALAERSDELAKELWRARQELERCEPGNQVDSWARNQVDVALGAIERRIIELSDSGRPALRIVGGKG